MSHKKRNNYVLFSLVRNYKNDNYEWVPSYYNRSGLIHKIASSEYYSGQESILNNLSQDMKETKPVITNIKINKYTLTKYMTYYRMFWIGVETPEGLVKLDISTIMDEINDALAKIESKRIKTSKFYNARKRAEQYEFRKGPVPNIHNYNNCHRGTWYRYPQLGSVRKAETDTEYAEYFKPKNKPKNLPVWDDRCRQNDRSWKSSCKISKQWQKHKPKHKYTIKYDKRAYGDIDNFTEDEITN